jgi:hypothetical protein
MDFTGTSSSSHLSHNGQFMASTQLLRFPKYGLIQWRFLRRRPLTEQWRTALENFLGHPGLTRARSETYGIGLLPWGPSPMLGPMKRNAIVKAGELLLYVGGAAVGIAFALLSTLRDLFAAADTSDEEEDDVSASAYTGGTLNYRTGKLDDGTDPCGWYGKD